MDDEYFEKFGYPLFYDSEEEYMPEKQKPRRYTEVVASLETHIVYISTHLQNIDAHLERQNSNIDKHGNRLTSLETAQETIQGKPIGLSKKQAVSLGGSLIVVGSFVAGVLNYAARMVGWW